MDDSISQNNYFFSACVADELANYFKTEERSRILNSESAAVPAECTLASIATSERLFNLWMK